jgi:hypothetical protein
VNNAGTASGTVSPTTVSTVGLADKWGTGVGVGTSGTLFAYFGGGAGIPTIDGTTVSGPRLRMGSGSFSPAASVLIGSSTSLGDSSSQFGSVAYDSGFNRVYVCRQASDSSLPAVLVFTPDQFSGSYNQAPARTLGDTVAELPALRILAHGGDKDWLVGADWVSASSGTGSGTNKLRIWKGPANGGKALSFTLDSGVVVRGLALDGEN